MIRNNTIEEVDIHFGPNAAIDAMSGQTTDTSQSTLAELAPGQSGTVVTIAGDGNLKRRLASMGLVKGVTVSVDMSAPLGDPRAYRLMDYVLSLRNADARKVVVIPLADRAS